MSVGILANAGSEPGSSSCKKNLRSMPLCTAGTRYPRLEEGGPVSNGNRTGFYRSADGSFVDSLLSASHRGDSANAGLLPVTPSSWTLELANYRRPICNSNRALIRLSDKAISWLAPFCASPAVIHLDLANRKRRTLADSLLGCTLRNSGAGQSHAQDVITHEYACSLFRYPIIDYTQLQLYYSYS